MGPHGICFYDPKYKFWTGSFVDSTDAAAIKMCYDAARGLLNPNEQLPPDGDIVAVNFQIDPAATQRIMGANPRIGAKRESFEEWVKRHAV